jgi:hypothetical protein
LVVVALVVVALFGRPIFYIARSYWRDRDDIAVLPSGVVDDASRLNRARVAEVWQVPDDPAAAEEQLRALLKRARAAKVPISIAGARHSMGGHTIAPDGIAVQMLGFRRMDFDDDSGILTVGAGALWANVLPFLIGGGDAVQRLVLRRWVPVGKLSRMAGRQIPIHIDRRVVSTDDFRWRGPHVQPDRKR